MKKPLGSPSVGLELLIIQMTWTLMGFGIFLLINIVKMVFGIEVDSYYSGGYIASNIFMFVIGIISINFLPHYVGLGITRKNYFYGNVIASIGLSIFIPIGIYIISLVEKLIIGNFTSIELRERALDKIEIDSDGNIVSEIIQSFIVTPFIDPSSNLVLSLALFSLHIFVFYIIGWMIAAAFQRLGVIGGLLFIAVGIVFIAIKDTMIRITLDLPLFKNFSVFEVVPEKLALPTVFAAILLTMIIIRLLTKRTPLKI